MNLIVTPVAPPRPTHRTHTPLAAADPHGHTATRAADRATVIPGRRPATPITFNSAL
ncbi:hypothetical protein [Streptomyces sp. NBC_00035]|uniref:hypothetical protein n=1 Tax=Streptomyces sp. NBC_00035 TaxID=2903614 RepID=UPI0032453D8E